MARATSGLMILVVLVAAGCLGGTSDPDPGDPVQGGGEPFSLQLIECTALTLLFSADAASVRGFVPAQFTIVSEPTGRVPLSVGLAACEVSTIDGGPVSPVLLSDVGVQIEAPDGSDGTHSYQLWQLSNRSALASRMQALGIHGGYLADMTADITPAPVGETFAAEVPWGTEGYTLTATSAPSLPVPTGRTSVWWHLGPHGLARIEYTFTVAEITAASGTVVTSEHTALGHALGESPQGAGSLLRFEGSATATLVDANPST